MKLTMGYWSNGVLELKDFFNHCIPLLQNSNTPFVFILPLLLSSNTPGILFTSKPTFPFNMAAKFINFEITSKTNLANY